MCNMCYMRQANGDPRTKSAVQEFITKVGLFKLEPIPSTSRTLCALLRVVGASCEAVQPKTQIPSTDSTAQRQPSYQLHPSARVTSCFLCLSSPTLPHHSFPHRCGAGDAEVGKVCTRTMVMLHRSARLATVAIGVLVSVSEAFLSGAPGPRSKLPTPSKPESKTRVDDLESRSSR